jgi:DNA-binding transcriptional MerR regulator
LLIPFIAAETGFRASLDTDSVDVVNTVNNLYTQGMPDLLSTEELIERVREETQHLTFNGRIDAQLSERTIRYYVTMKYVSPPQRHQGRSVWTEDHVRELVRIRRAQSAGQSLSEIGRAQPRVIDTSWKVANSLGARSKETLSPALSLNLSTVYHSVTAPQTGWSVSLAPSLFLSGFTDRRPTQTEIQGVMSALSSLIADIDDETKDGQS